MLLVELVGGVLCIALSLVYMVLANALACRIAKICPLDRIYAWVCFGSGHVYMAACIVVGAFRGDGLYHFRLNCVMFMVYYGAHSLGVVPRRPEVF